MPNIMDYLDWRGDLSLAVSPFNEVDNYICAMVVTPDYTGVARGEQSLRELIAAYDALHGEAGNRLGTLASPYTVPMLRRLGDTVRFGELRVRDFERRYDAEITEQFSAATVLLPVPPLPEVIMVMVAAIACRLSNQYHFIIDIHRKSSVFVSFICDITNYFAVWSQRGANRITGLSPAGCFRG